MPPEKNSASKIPAATAESFKRLPAVARHQLPLALVRHGGTCAVTPRALFELARVLDSELHLRISPLSEPIALTDPAIFQYPILFFPGRNAFVLSGAERQRLREYVDRGGSILADAICSSPTFADSFRREVSEVFGTPFQPIPIEDILLRPDLGGYDLRQLRRKLPGQSAISAQEARWHIGPPVLEGIQRDGRWAVIFSPLRYKLCARRLYGSRMPGLCTGRCLPPLCQHLDLLPDPLDECPVRLTFAAGTCSQFFAPLASSCTRWPSPYRTRGIGCG